MENTWPQVYKLTPHEKPWHFSSVLPQGSTEKNDTRVEGMEIEQKQSIKRRWEIWYL